MLKNLRRATNLVLKERNDELIEDVVSHEQQIDRTTNILITYLAKINNLNINEKEHIEIEHLMSICSDVERIGDHAENISENARQMLDDEVIFSDEGRREMENIVDITIKAVENGIRCVEFKDKESLKIVRKYEEEVDALEDEYKANHIKRMSAGECDMLAGIAFLDIIGNLERVTDHANNLADYVEAENKNEVLIKK